jgi:hypothetical protein
VCDGEELKVRRILEEPPLVVFQLPKLVNDQVLGLYPNA